MRMSGRASNSWVEEYEGGGVRCGADEGRELSRGEAAAAAAGSGLFLLHLHINAKQFNPVKGSYSKRKYFYLEALFFNV